MIPERLRRLLAAPARSAMGIIAVVATLPLLLGMRYQGRDHTLVLLGFACAHRDRARLVLDPALGGGGPILQDPHGHVFYPLTWLLRPLPAELAASLYVVLHLAIAAGAAARLASELGAGRRAALATGLAFALCGTVMDLIVHGSFLCAAAWLPLGWAGVRALARGPSRWGSAALSGALGMLVLGGEPQSAVILSLVAAVELGALASRRRPPRVIGRAALRVTLAGVLGAMLSAVQVVATVGLGSAPARAKGVGAAERWALDGLGALGLVLPVSLTEDGAHGTSLASTWNGSPLNNDLWNASPYLGALVLAGALTGAAARVRGTAAVLGIGALALSVGAKLGALPVLAAVVPPVGYFRYPEKYLTLASLALLVCAVQTWSIARRAPRMRASLQRSVLGVTGVLVLMLAGAALRAGEIDRMASRFAVLPLNLPDLPSVSTLLLSNLALATSVALLGALLLSSPLRARWAPALLVADLALFAVRVVPLGSSVLDVPSPREAALPPGSMLCHGVGPTPFVPFILGAEQGPRRGVVYNRVELRPGLNQCSRVASPNLYLPTAQLPTLHMAYTMLDPSQATGVQVARALGCTHLLAPFAAHPSLRPLPTVPGLVRLYAVPDPLPELSIVRAPVLVSRLGEVIRGLREGGGADDVVRWIDDPDRGRATPLPAGLGVTAARVAWRGTTEGVLQLDGTGGAVAVVRRPWWPGWSATQSGRRLRTLRAGGVHLAVVIPDVTAGPVQLRYEVRGLGAGAALSAVGLCALLALTFLRRRDRGVTAG